MTTIAHDGAAVGPVAVRRAREVASLPRYPAALLVLQTHYDDGVPEPEVAEGYGTYSDRWGLMALRVALKQGNVGVVHDAEEVVQDALVKMWRLAVRPRKFDPSRSENGLLSRTVVNESYGYHKKVRPTVDLDDAVGPAPRGLVLDNRQRERERRLVREAFVRARRNPGWQSSFDRIVLLRLEGTPSRQIAAELGLSTGTVDNYFSTARRMLLDAVQCILSEGDDLL